MVSGREYQERVLVAVGAVGAVRAMGAAEVGSDHDHDHDQEI